MSPPSRFRPAAYLNGLLVGDRDGWLGSIGPKMVELAQVWNHLRKGRYLGYSTPQVQARARSLLLLSPVDAGLRGVARAWLARCARNPLRLLRRLHLQSVMIIQPVDQLADGRQSMCDACPDMTVHNGELVWSCRLDERLKYGQLLRVVPNGKAAQAIGRAAGGPEPR